MAKSAWRRLVSRRSIARNTRRRWSLCPTVHPVLWIIDTVRPWDIGTDTESVMSVYQWSWGTRIISPLLTRILLTQVFRRLFQVDLVFSPCAAYAVDIMHTRSAESMAASKSVPAASLCRWELTRRLVAFVPLSWQSPYQGSFL